MTRLPLLALLPLALATPAIAVAQSQEARRLDSVQVTATRVPRERHSTAASVTVVDAAQARRDQPGVALSELLHEMPGVLARPRQNLAQDEQIAIRGFGTRASFGLRGARLYVDGVPATMPDGQGQTAHFPLAAAERVEVLRGPFSALYGNAAGGVISLVTPDGGGPTQLRAAATVGRFGLRRASASVEGAAGAEGGYFIAANALQLDGWRRHSAARRHGLHGKWRMPLADGQLSLVANLFRMPQVRDPQGLTWQQAQDDPRQASAGALRFDTRKTVRQDQLGAVWERTRGDDGIRLMVYGGRRAIQ